MSSSSTLTPSNLDSYVESVIETQGLELARQMVLSHPAVFAAYIFKLTLKDFHTLTLEAAHNEKRVIILFPEAHGKSTLVSRILPLYELALNPNLRIIVMMKTDEYAGQYATFMQAVLDPKTGNKRFLRLFGNWVDKRRWTKSEMDIAPRQIHDQFPSLRFMGAKPTAVGTGCDILFADDLIDYENSRTPAAREHLSGWWHTTAQSMPRSMWDRDLSSGWLQVPEDIIWPREKIDDAVAEYARRGYYEPDRVPDRIVREVDLGKPREYERIVITCTLYHVDDLISVKVGDTDELPFGKLVQAPGDETYKVLYFDCFRDKDEKEALWPEHRSIEWLLRERLSRGFLEFNKRLRNKPVDEASVAIKQVYIRGGDYEGVHHDGCLARDVSVGEYDKRDLLVCGLDPGSGRTRKSSNWTGLVLLAGDPDQPKDTLPKVRVVDIRRMQVGYDDIIALAFDGNGSVGSGLHKLYSYDMLAVEINDKQIWLLQNPVVKKKKLEYPGLLQMWETTGKNKLSPETGIRSIDAAFKDSLVEIPWRKTSDQDVMVKLVDELCKYPDGSGDLVVAFWMAYRTFLSQLRQAQAFYDESFTEGPYMMNPVYEQISPPRRRVEHVPAPSTGGPTKFEPIIVTSGGRLKE